MSGSLEELSILYFDAAQNLETIIAKYRKELNAAYRSRNYLKTYELKRKLSVLYDQRRDVLTTAHTLKNYYNTHKEVKSA